MRGHASQVPGNNFGCGGLYLLTQSCTEWYCIPRPNKGSGLITEMAGYIVPIGAGTGNMQCAWLSNNTVTA